MEGVEGGMSGIPCDRKVVVHTAFTAETPDTPNTTV